MTNYLLSAFVKIIFILIILALFKVYALPYAETLKLIIQYYFSMGVYKALPAPAFALAAQFAVLFSSLKLGIWIFAPGADDTAPGQSPTGSTDQKTGFTTRSIYH